MQAVLGWINGLFETFAIKRVDDRPIGLRHLGDVSNNDVLNHLSTPATPLPSFKPTLSKKGAINTPPAFAYTPPLTFNYQRYQEITSIKRYPGYPRR